MRKGEKGTQENQWYYVQIRPDDMQTPDKKIVLRNPEPGKGPPVKSHMRGKTHKENQNPWPN